MSESGRPMASARVQPKNTSAGALQPVMNPAAPIVITASNAVSTIRRSIDGASRASGDSSIKASANAVPADFSSVMSFSCLRSWVRSLKEAGEAPRRQLHSVYS